MHFKIYFCLIWVPASERYFDNTPWALGPGPCPSLRLRRRRHSRRPGGWPALRRRRGAEVEVRKGVGLRWIASSCRGRVLLGSLDSHPMFFSLRWGADRKTSIEIQESLGFFLIECCFFYLFLILSPELTLSGVEAGCSDDSTRNQHVNLLIRHLEQ